MKKKKEWNNTSKAPKERKYSLRSFTQPVRHAQIEKILGTLEPIYGLIKSND